MGSNGRRKMLGKCAWIVVSNGYRESRETSEGKAEREKRGNEFDATSFAYLRTN